MAVTTAAALCVKVAQPRPYKPGSVVSTFTTTRLGPCGAVAIAFTLLIFTVFKPLVETDACLPGDAFLAAASGSAPKIPSKPAAEPAPNIFIILRRSNGW